MKNYIKIGYVLTALVLCSCGDFLDAKPDKSLVIPSTLNDFQALLDAEPRSMNVYPSLGFISSDEVVLGESLIASLDNEARGCYFWEEEFYLPGDFSGNWASSYGKVFYANLVIEGIENFKSSTDGDRSRAIVLDASARFYRAFAYSGLMDIYSLPYSEETKESLGVPLRTTANINVINPRASQQEVYDLIISDLQIASMNLPDKPEVLTRPSKWAAEALLARVFLTLQDFENAEIHSYNALTIDNTLEDYNKLPQGLTYKFPRFNKEVIHQVTMGHANYISNAQTYINPEIYDLYDSLDLRKTVFYTPSTTDSGFHNVIGRYSGDFYNFSGLAVDEVLLTHAEAAFQNGNEELAIADLEYLLNNRFVSGTYKGIGNLSGMDLLKVILEERRKELVFRGIRWIDLRRLNIDNSLQVAISRKYNVRQAELKPNDLKYALPIPPNELELNPIIQNAR